jgi:hypothetical protein
MLKFMKNFFGFGKAEPSAAPYKIEAPVTNVAAEVPVVNVAQPMVNGRKAPVKKTVATAATGNVPAKKPANKKPAVKKAPAKKK